MAQIKVNMTYGATGTLPAVSGANLTSLNGTQVTSGTLPMARLSGTLPALNGSALTTLNASNVSSGTLNASRYVDNEGGITVADQWRINATFSGDANPVTSNWEQVDTSGQGTIGSAMTESSGVFTFPSTGIYLVRFISGSRAYSGNAERSYEIFIDVTTNNSSYVNIAECHQCGSGSGSSDLNVSTETLVDVTDVANVKVRFGIDAYVSNTMTLANSAENNNMATFIRMGDT